MCDGYNKLVQVLLYLHFLDSKFPNSDRFFLILDLTEICVLLTYILDYFWEVIRENEMSSELHIVALITPAEGKESRVKELLLDLGNKVKQHETDVVGSPLPFYSETYTKPTTLAQIRNLRAIQRTRTKCLRRRRNL